MACSHDTSTTANLWEINPTTDLLLRLGDQQKLLSQDHQTLMRTPLGEDNSGCEWAKFSPSYQQFRSWMHWISGILCGNFTNKIEFLSIRNLQLVFSTSTSYVPITPFGQNFGLGRGRHAREHIYYCPYEETNASSITSGHMNPVDRMACVLWTCLPIFSFEFVSIGIPETGDTEPTRFMDIIRPSTMKRTTKPVTDIQSKFTESMPEEDMFALCNVAKKLPYDCNTLRPQVLKTVVPEKPKSGKKRGKGSSPAIPEPPSSKGKGKKPTIYTHDAMRAKKRVNLHSPRVVLRCQPELIAFLKPFERVELTSEFWEHYRQFQGLCIFTQSEAKGKRESRKIVVSTKLHSRKHKPSPSELDLNSGTSSSSSSPAAKRVMSLESGEWSEGHADSDNDPYDPFEPTSHIEDKLPSSSAKAVPAVMTIEPVPSVTETQRPSFAVSEVPSGPPSGPAWHGHAQRTGYTRTYVPDLEGRDHDPRNYAPGQLGVYIHGKFVDS